MTPEQHQNKIDRDSNDVKVLSALVHTPIPGGWETWRIEGLLGVSCKEALRTLWRLKTGFMRNKDGVKIEFVWRHTRYRTEYWGATDAGREWLAEIVEHNAPVITGESAFRAEALTGMDLSGERSSIEWAALPKSLGDFRTVSVVEPSIFVRRQWIEAAKSLGLSTHELEEYILEGRVRLCPGFDGSTRQAEHLGVFSPKGNSRWHEICNECRKEKIQNEQTTKRKDIHGNS
jgi:hypothetical protein